MSVSFEDVDQSWVSLKKIISGYDFALFLGAGISIPNKLPSWSGLTAMLSKKDQREVENLERSGISLSAQIGIAKNVVNSQKDGDWIEVVRSNLYRATLEQIESSDLKIPGLSRNDLWRNPAHRARVVEFFVKRIHFYLKL